MEEQQKRWLISNKDIEMIRNFLTPFQEILEERTDYRLMIDTALYLLDIGLNKTDAVPDDFKEE